MTSLLITTFCLGCCVGMTYTFGVYRIAERRYKRKTMRKFEYYTVYLRPGEIAVQVLDQYGDDGWEAFQIIQDGDGMVVYFKREKCQ